MSEGWARREACAQWALGPKAQSDPKRGSETMSATVREARMIEQPGMGPARKRAADKQVAKAHSMNAGGGGHANSTRREPDYELRA